MRPCLLVPLTLTIALASSANASHCTTWTTSTTDEDTIVVDLGPAAVDFRYLVADVCPIDDPCPTLYPYYEGNEIPGLQRGDHTVDDTCHGMIRPDSIMH